VLLVNKRERERESGVETNKKFKFRSSVEERNIRRQPDEERLRNFNHSYTDLVKFHRSHFILQNFLSASECREGLDWAVKLAGNSSEEITVDGRKNRKQSMMILMVVRNPKNVEEFQFYGKTKLLVIPESLDRLIRAVFRLQQKITTIVIKVLESIPVCEEQTIHVDVWGTVETNKNISIAIGVLEGFTHVCEFDSRFDE
jgi:hypothetical protein